eukprot:TRINITY_DN34641_c0_g1_i1.p1 TRINITY_DN34641_c0_g1~~TRINITY_DN34641_c0_g1_i1.p1  ORF type:complete len:577 (+),score=109.66 TRINITY_DN34641_c0_g1_i1:46-1776(+)
MEIHKRATEALRLFADSAVYRRDGVVRCPKTEFTPGGERAGGVDDIEDCSLKNFDGEADRVCMTVAGSVFEETTTTTTIVFRPADYTSKENREFVRAKPLDCATEPLQLPLKDIQTNKSNAARAHIGEGAIRFGVLLATLQRAGLVLTKDFKNTKCVLVWAKRIKPDEYALANEKRKFNHFPGTWGMGRKDLLSKNLKKMLKKHPKSGYDIHPATYLLPSELKQLARHMTDTREVFILKPNAAACGMGIRLTASPPIDVKEPCIAQRYIQKPLLINNTKFDLRLYMVVTSVNPLRVFLYNEGLVRFATEIYPGGTTGLENQYAHLTNYSINKHNTENFENPDDDGNSEAGSKWLLSTFKNHCNENGYPWDLIWTQICDVAVKTVLSVEEDLYQKHAAHVGSGNGCFEIFGVDVLVEESFKVSLLEVNIMPSVNTVSPLDAKVKCNFLADLLTLVGIAHPSPQQQQQQPPLLRRSSSKLTPVDPLKPPYPTIGEYLPVLSPHLQAVIKASEDECHRKGAFSRVFPTLHTHGCYEGLVQRRSYNTLLYNWELVKLATWKSRGMVLPELPTIGRPVSTT